MTHWFPPDQLATKMFIWKHLRFHRRLGCSRVLRLHRRFWGLALGIPSPQPSSARWPRACSVDLLRDTPSSVGLPEIKASASAAGDNEDKNSADYKAFVRQHVFCNPFIWWISIANFFV